MIRRHIPNMLTLGNLFCGCLAIHETAQGRLVTASYFVAVSLIFDFLDGFVARLLKVASPIGKDLDSLADMVTFGVLPGFIMFRLIRFSLSGEIETSTELFDPAFAGMDQILPLTGFVITLFSCLRLAKFNNDTRQSDSFIGVPTPAVTILVASIGMLLTVDPQAVIWMMDAKILVSLVALLSFLLVSELPLIALKFNSFSWNDNAIKYVLIALTVLLVFLLGLAALPLTIVLYIALSIVNNIFLKKRV